MYHFLADIVDFVHLAYVGFVVIGLPVILVGAALQWSWVRNFWFRLAHLVMILIVALEAATSFMCPLTHWHNELRQKAGDTVDESATFIGRVANSVLYVQLPYDHPVFQFSYYGFAALVLLTFWLAPPRWPWSRRLDGKPRAKPDGESSTLRGDAQVSRT